MGIRSQRLLELQQLDLEVDSKTEALAQVESQLGESEELVAAREALRQEKERREQLESTQRSLEWQAEDLWSKIEPAEEKLYSGRVKNAKELRGLQQEVEGLKANRGKVEDHQLDIMTELEDSLPVLHEREKGLAEVEAAWRADQERLMAEESRLKAEIESAEEKKQALIKLIPPSDLDLYAELRESKRGRGVSRLERGTCQGCRISLPMTEIQRARSSSSPVRCSSCGRILVVD